MTMQRIQLDISSDIYDKVIFFLENLPKNTLAEFFQTSPLVDNISLDRHQEQYKGVNLLHL
jgi:hypothetical protein